MLGHISPACLCFSYAFLLSFCSIPFTFGFIINSSVCLPGPCLWVTRWIITCFCPADATVGMFNKKPEPLRFNWSPTPRSQQPGFCSLGWQQLIYSTKVFTLFSCWSSKGKLGSRKVLPVLKNVAQWLLSLLSLDYLIRWWYWNYTNVIISLSSQSVQYMHFGRYILSLERCRVTRCPLFWGYVFFSLVFWKKNFIALFLVDGQYGVFL